MGTARNSTTEETIGFVGRRRRQRSAQRVEPSQRPLVFSLNKHNESWMMRAELQIQTRKE